MLKANLYWACIHIFALFFLYKVTKKSKCVSVIVYRKYMWLNKSFIIIKCGCLKSIGIFTTINCTCRNPKLIGRKWSRSCWIMIIKDIYQQTLWKLISCVLFQVRWEQGDIQKWWTQVNIFNVEYLLNLNKDITKYESTW